MASIGGSRGAASILVVEDDQEVAGILSEHLETSGFHVSHVGTGSDALRNLRRLDPDLVILDLQLPDVDGLVLCSTFKRLSPAPILICSGRQQQRDRVLGLRLGADDFVGKPFDLDEIEARVDILLRRATPAVAAPPVAEEPEQLAVGDLTIRFADRSVLLASEPLQLTPIEFQILVALAAQADQVVSRGALIEQAWGLGSRVTSHLLDVHMARLRRKLDEAADGRAPMILTVRGRGYLLRNTAA